MICKSFLETELTNWKRPLLCVFVLHSQNVLHRHPLYLIVRMLCYDDGLGAGKNLLALKTTDTEQEECSIWVYQCSSSVSTKWKDFYTVTVRFLSLMRDICCLSEQEQAQSICKVLSASFDCVLTSDKSRGSEWELGWERNICKTSNS